ncbi:hypothetical protein Pcinc_038069 [Petrolisthes cinctipes]|uniref:Uncharacterized protein n=1 Tax=Petrolisthes cinctipes TaxID=88211 RepID=A0AAE1EKE3_PETCI|nr:hypothetical protein Pcinc_038069 [Petrolisthes cinctipes]
MRGLVEMVRELIEGSEDEEVDQQGEGISLSPNNKAGVKVKDARRGGGGGAGKDWKGNEEEKHKPGISREREKEEQPGKDGGEAGEE